MKGIAGAWPRSIDTPSDVGHLIRNMTQEFADVIRRRQGIPTPPPGMWLVDLKCPECAHWHTRYTYRETLLCDDCLDHVGCDDERHDLDN